MNIRFDEMSSLPRIGETIRLVPEREEDTVIGIFNTVPEAAVAVHLRLAEAGEYYSHIFQYAGDDSRRHAIDTLLLPGDNGYGYAAAQGCRVFLEQQRHSRPLVDPEYFYVAGPRQRELQLSFVRRIGRSVGGLFSHTS